MKKNICYIVTKGNSTFKKGDHILFDGNIIICKEARGWIDKEDISKVIKGLVFEKV